ncbi:MAG: T9SS type A sorting domain-containing protein [Ignavibacteriaceae bacterium]|nr:T9SS type A sorting domain-containing protein [Ignavibacteriaceae bacterium]
MKSIVFSLFLISSILTFSQTFHSLDGNENPLDGTNLIYRLGVQGFNYSPVYILNVNTGVETKIIDAYYNSYPGSETAKAILDFEFFPSSEDFVNCGFMIYPDNHSYIARNDTIVYGGMSGFNRIDISKQNPLKVFAFAGGPLTRSFDGGYTYPEDSIGLITNFDAISLADFDDNVLFGIDYDGQLAKNAVVVDTSKFFFDQYTKFLYDVNQFHIYRVNKTYGGYALSVSNNKGEAYTWTKAYESNDPLFITIDSLQSGTIYLADGRRIYKSTNNGFTFYNYKDLISNIIGLYKKPGSDILYASTQYAIFEITPDSITIIKSLPTSPDVFQWFPLAVGNRWVFSSYWKYYNPSGTPSYQFAGTKYMDVVTDTIIEGKQYFILENDLLNQFVFEQRMFLRVDSISGRIFRYWETLSNEFLFHDLNAELGDTVYYPLYPEQPYYYLWNEHENIFLNEMRMIREYFEYAPCGCYHWLIKGLGLGTAVFDEFGGAEDNLKGVVLNGVVYGDTSFVVSVEDEKGTIPTEFKLYQNYPNPFNPVTKIKYTIPTSPLNPSPYQGEGQRERLVTLKVYDILGNEVATLVNEEKPAGNYDLTWNAASFPSGVYFYQLRADDFVQTRKMVLLK